MNINQAMLVHTFDGDNWHLLGSMLSSKALYVNVVEIPISQTIDCINTHTIDSNNK